MLRVPDVKNDGFFVSAEMHGALVRVRIKGNADMQSLTDLDAFLRALYVQVLKLAVNEVSFDMRDLYFMNSSCLRCFVTFIIDDADLGTAQRFRIKFISNPTLHWQRKSLDALKACGDDLVSVEISG
jgi:hypothetical protein